MDWGRFKTFERIVSIDPGGFELGIAFFEKGILKSTETFHQDDKDALNRRIGHYRKLEDILRTSDLIISEEPFIRGVGNTNMQRMFGVFEWLTDFKISFINPMTVKKYIGNGKLEKAEVAKGTLVYLSDSEKTIVEKLIVEERWNETDAIAVCLAWILKQNEGNLKMAGKKKTTKKGSKGKKGC